MLKKAIITMVSLLMLLTACGTNPSKTEKQGTSETNLPEDNQIIDKHGDVKNLKRLDDFVQNVNEGKGDEIKITHYTIEGDPIYDTVTYDGKQLTITNDNTEDKFGSPEITTYTCKNIIKDESATELNYMLMDCEAPDGSQGNEPLIIIR